MEATAPAEPTTVTETPSGNAPATAEPTSATTTEPTRPTSMRDAFERVEKKQKAAATPTDTATTAPAAAGTKPAVTPGVPPPTEWPKILDNARAKAKEEGAAQYREKFGWAEKISEPQLKQWGSMANRIATDPIGYASDLVKEIEAHPVHGPAWKARHGSAQPATTTDQPLDPDVQIVDDTGQPVGKTFSADRVQAIVKKAVADAIGQEVQPLKTEYQQRQAAVEKQRMADLEKEQTERSHKSADSILANVYRILEFSAPADGKSFTTEQIELINEVDKTMAQNPGMDAHTAALEVREKKVVPKLKGAATQEAMTEFQRKANGNTANGNGRTAMPKKPKTREELAAWMRDNDKTAS